MRTKAPGQDGGPQGLPAVPKSLPANPVRLFSDDDDPCVRQLQVLSFDQVGLLFKLCELLTAHGIDVVSAEVVTEDGIVNNRFELHTSRPSDFADANDWCKELEDFLARNHASGGTALEGSLSSLSKRLSVNPDLLSVVSFRKLPTPDGSPVELRYYLELAGINQAGLLTYTALVLYRSGFSVVRATISTYEGHVSDTFELSTTSVEAEHLLRSYLDMPSLVTRKDTVPLPFHATPSDGNLEALMHMWGRHTLISGSSPPGSFSSSPRVSRAGSFTEEDQEAWVAARSRLSSAVSDREEPHEARRSSGAAENRSRLPSADSKSSTQSPSGGAHGRRRDSRRMSVHFANGDVYTGNCALFEGGEKRHGLGTYVYSPSSHETYKQYRGQWREDKKHGYGVLFFRNGGVYVGQWENNQKHGLGVLLDNAGDNDATQMPTFRYEGLWHEDEPHGLGAEESDASSYFGHFVRGKRQGRGVRMNLAKMGLSGCEVLDTGVRCMPLLAALEAEMVHMRRPSRASSPPQGRTMSQETTNYESEWSGGGEVQVPGACFDKEDERSGRRSVKKMPSSKDGRHGMPPPTAIPVDGLPWAAANAARAATGATVASENESGSSGKTSGDTRSPMSVRLQHLPQPPASPEGQETPMPAGAGPCGMKAARTPLGAFPNMVSPLEAQPTPLLGGRGTRSGSSSGSALLAAAADRQLATAHVGGGAGELVAEGGATSSKEELKSSSSGSSGTAGALAGTYGSTRGHGRDRCSRPSRSRSASPRSKSASADLIASPRDGWNGGGVGGSIVFSLWEENNLLASPDTTLGHPIPEEAPRKSDGDDDRPASRSQSGEAPPLLGPACPGVEAWSRSTSADEELKQLPAQTKKVPRLPKQSVSDPWLPAPTSGTASASAPVQHARGNSTGEVGTAAAAGASAGNSHCGPAAAEHPDCGRRRPSKKDSRHGQPVRTPLLWSEDELAAFIACLGIREEICARVQQRTLKGAGHILEMTNSELRREFDLVSPVERLVVRQSLKRLLDADRWENSVRGHKVGDILSDSVLGKFIVPLEELTLLTKISQGGYGTVYRGVLEPSVERGTLQANRPHLVAVKEMKGERRVRLYELLKEACVMASLKHPNICTFIGVCADASARKHYIISELMDCSLFDLIHQPYKLRWHGELTVMLVVGLSQAICAGIVYIHGRNLVHADLKSSNILIDYSTSWQLIPRICDFGHAAVRTFPSPHHRCGTPHWAGPEVLRSEALGPAADIYSFGVIMWEMLTQKLPHKGLSFGQVLASVGWAGWTPDLDLLPEVPSELSRLLRECLCFSPSMRPKSKDVQRRLRRIPKQARLKALKMLAAFLG